MVLIIGIKMGNAMIIENYSTLDGIEDLYAYTSAGAPHSSLIKFNISNISKNAHIQEAKLGLYVVQVVGTAVTVYGTNCSNQSWTENLAPATMTFLVSSCTGSTHPTQSITTTGWKLYTLTNEVNASYSNNEKNFTVMLNGTGQIFGSHATYSTGDYLYASKTNYDYPVFNSSEATATACGGKICSPYLQVKYTTCNCPSTGTWVINTGETCVLSTACVLSANSKNYLIKSAAGAFSGLYVLSGGRLITSGTYIERGSKFYVSRNSNGVYWRKTG